jgi:hypothetical protein
MKTSDNRANLSPAALEAFYEEFGGTRLGQQELDGEWIMALEGDLLKRAWWKYYPPRRQRETDHSFTKRLPRFSMVIVSVDTPLKDKESGDFVAIQCGRQQRPTSVLRSLRFGDRKLFSARTRQRRPVRPRRNLPQHHAFAGGGSRVVSDGRHPPIPRRPSRRLVPSHQLVALPTITQSQNLVVVQTEMTRAQMMFNIGWLFGLLFGVIAGLTLGYHIWA